MKKFCIIAVVSVSLWACAKKIAPVATPEMAAIGSADNTPNTAGTGRINMALLERGKKTFELRCGRCHALKQPEAYTQQRWVTIMESMALKAQLDETQKAEVLAYVQHNAKDAPKDKSNM